MSTQHELLDAAIKQVGNRYLATMLVAKRIRQLHHGAPAYVQREDGDSYFTVAMREIAQGHVVMQPLAIDPADAPEPTEVVEIDAMDNTSETIETADTAAQDDT